MELESFKSILLRKADGNKNIIELLNNVEEDFFINSVVEALEKMSKLSGTNANGPLTSFGANLDKTDVTQLRDALGHHLSHYKAALKAHHTAPEGTPQKTHMRQVADQHLEHAIPLMHLIDRAAAHSNGKLKMSYPPLAPWETNYTTLQMANTGKKRLLRDPKLLRVRPAKNAKKRTDPDSDPNATTIPDYHYLEMPPHPGHDMVSKMPHQGGYPWEEIQVGPPDKVETKSAYIPIDDIPDKKEYTPHEFDQHPIRGVQDIQADHLTPETMQGFAGALANWRGGEHHKKWMANQKAKWEADKEGYINRGTKKSAPLYEGIPLQEHLSHVHNVPAKPKFQAEAAEAPVSAKTTPPPAKAAAPVAQAAPAAAAPAKTQHELESAYQVWKNLPKEHQGNILKAIPGFADYVASKGGK